MNLGLTPTLGANWIIGKVYFSQYNEYASYPFASCPFEILATLLPEMPTEFFTIRRYIKHKKFMRWNSDQNRNPDEAEIVFVDTNDDFENDSDDPFGPVIERINQTIINHDAPGLSWYTFIDPSKQINGKWVDWQKLRANFVIQVYDMVAGMSVSEFSFKVEIKVRWNESLSRAFIDTATASPGQFSILEINFQDY